MSVHCKKVSGIATVTALFLFALGLFNPFQPDPLPTGGLIPPNLETDSGPEKYRFCGQAKSRIPGQNWGEILDLSKNVLKSKSEAKNIIFVLFLACSIGRKISLFLEPCQGGGWGPDIPAKTQGGRGPDPPPTYHRPRN